MKKRKKDEKVQFSKRLILDVRGLLWIISVGGILLGFYCVYKEFTSSLGWVTTLVGLPWASHATICSLYLNKSKAENTAADGTGIVYAAAAAHDFMENYQANLNMVANMTQYDQSTSYEVEEEYEYLNEWDDINSPPI